MVFPLALLPIVGFAAAASGLSTVALLQILRIWIKRARAYSTEIPRKISRSLSRSLSRSFSGEVNHLRPWNVARGMAALWLLWGLQKLRASLHSFQWALPMYKDEELDEDMRKTIQVYKDAQEFPWGDGLCERTEVHRSPQLPVGLELELPDAPCPGSWRPYLYEEKTAVENLEEIHGALGLVRRRPRDITIDQLIEGVRRVLMMKYHMMLRTSKHYWSKQQAQTIAEALALECNLEQPLASGGLEEIVPFNIMNQLPWPGPGWLQASIRSSIWAMRLVFHSTLSWRSRFVATPFGKLHVLDSHPSGRSLGGKAHPPLLLQHGMFVTGWSMAPVGWLLSREGRRVIMPDLFDFDHGNSISEGGSRAGKVRRIDEHLECLTCVVRDLLDTSPEVKEVDIAGHSFGGMLIAMLASHLVQKGLPVRKVVLLGPGGPVIRIHGDPIVSRFMNWPMQTIGELIPWWMPNAPVRAALGLALSVLFSPNNVNTLFGLRYQEYLGQTSSRFGTELPTLLLWGDQDKIAWPRSEERLMPYLNKRFPNLEAFWVEGGDHNIQIDSFVAISRCMDDFLGPICGGKSKIGVGTFGLGSFFRITDRRLTAMNLLGGRHPPDNAPSQSKL